MDRFLQVAEEDRRRAEERDRRADLDRERTDRTLMRIADSFSRTFKYHYRNLAIQEDNNRLFRELLKAVRGWGNGRSNGGGNSQPRNRR